MNPIFPSGGNLKKKVWAQGKGTCPRAKEVVTRCEQSTDIEIQPPRMLLLCDQTRDHVMYLSWSPADSQRDPAPYYAARDPHRISQQAEP